MLISSRSLGVALAALYLSAAPAFAHDVGAVLKVKRDAYGTPANAAREAKAKGDSVSDHELLETDAASKLTVRLADGSMMSLGASSKALVEAFAYQQTGSGATGKALINVPLGQLRFKTGAMPKGMTRIETPSADVTLHGTELKVQVNARGYTHIDVAEGSISVRSKYTGETVEVGAGSSINILPEGIRDGETALDRPALGSVENRRGDRAGSARSGSGGGESGGGSGGDGGDGGEGGGASD